MLSILISQMKELGVIFYNCSCLVLDLQRIFALYSSLKFKSRVPQTWSKRLYGVYDNEKKLQLQLNETKSQAFVSVSRILALLHHPPTTTTFVLQGLCKPASPTPPRPPSHSNLIASFSCNPLSPVSATPVDMGYLWCPCPAGSNKMQ